MIVVVILVVAVVVVVALAIAVADWTVLILSLLVGFVLTTAQLRL